MDWTLCEFDFVLGFGRGGLCFMDQQIFRKHRECNSHQGKSDSAIFVCCIRYNPGQFKVFFPGEMHGIQS